MFKGEEDMKDEKIRVGIIGAGGWAKYGHIPALQSLEEFEIVAVSSRKGSVAKQPWAQNEACQTDSKDVTFLPISSCSACVGT
jgi:predicted dehydrogenase